jgi:flagellum-specific ATP synthase
MNQVVHVNSYLNRWREQVTQAKGGVAALPSCQQSGKIVRATGLVLEAVGLHVPLGGACRIELPTEGGFAEAEVVGFAGDKSFLMPLAELGGLTPGARVFAMDNNRTARCFPLGPSLLGRVLDGNGRPLDGRPLPEEETRAPLATGTLNPLSRAPIDTPIDVGVRAINALLSVGRGQRMGLFAGSGVGKSVLLGMMARYTAADIIVVGLIGERGREVQEFVSHILGEEGLARAVVVAAPADNSPLLRLQGAAYATRLAEDFRDRGNHVLLIMDSLTRYAMAQREIALAIGEPPATKGYPPSVFAKLPALVEKAGNGQGGNGSITAFYTVLTEGDDQQDPIADSARAILDGHIVLSRALAEAGHYPAIDVEASISRVMTSIVPPAQVKRAQLFKQLFSRYQRSRDLIGVGAYSPGYDPQLDQAVRLYPVLETFLKQDLKESAPFADSTAALNTVLGEPANPRAKA